MMFKRCKAAGVPTQRHLPIGMADGFYVATSDGNSWLFLTRCQECGACVRYAEVHRRWHDDIVQALGGAA